MKFLVEEVKDAIRLTSHQKSILATIAQYGDPVADDTLASDSNLSGALKQLVKMQMIVNVQKDKYAMTDLGRKYATEENIIDDSGTITDDGKNLAINSTQTNESVGTFKDYLMLT